MKASLLVLGLLIAFLAHSMAAEPVKPISADEIVDRLAPPGGARTRALSTRAFKLEPRKLDFQIGFDFDSARIRAESTQQLDEIARAMATERLLAVRFRIEGHTDGVGTADYNESLSHRRARAVVDFLKAAGIDGARLEFAGKGMRELADPSNPQAAVNRRVRIVTLD